jgi:hypothetical protein
MADQVEEVDLINRDPNGINSHLGVSLYYKNKVCTVSCYAN